jgi:hypothetical protein
VCVTFLLACGEPDGRAQGYRDPPVGVLWVSSEAEVSYLYHSGLSCFRGEQVVTDCPGSSEPALTGIWLGSAVQLEAEVPPPFGVH